MFSCKKKKKLYNSLNGQKTRSFSPWTGPAQHGLRRSTQAPSDAAQVQASQHLRGHKIYSLSISFLLLYFIRTTISLSHLLSGLSYRDPERTLRCFSPSLFHTSLPSPLQNRHYLWWFPGVKKYARDLFCT